MASVLRGLAIRTLEGLTRLRGGGGRLLVLIYHRVLPQPDIMYPFDPDAAGFRRQMSALKEDFRVLGLQDALDRVRRGALPERAVAVTFDDGFADNVTHALPVLRDLELPATFFIASGYLDGGCMFHDCVVQACRHAPEGTWSTGTREFADVQPGNERERSALAYRMIAQIKYLPAQERMDCALRLLESARAEPPAGLMMTTGQLRQLHAAGMDIGGHTRSHPILARMDDNDAAADIQAGKSDLENILGDKIRLFAYPNGEPGRDYLPRDVGLVERAGFQGAVSTAWGFADRKSGRFEVPRVGSWGGSAWRYSGRLALARGGSRGRSCHTLAGNAAG